MAIFVKKFEREFKIAFGRLAGFVSPASRLPIDEILEKEPEKILVVRQHNQMGDMLLAVPALRGLRERFPRSQIVLVTASINREVVLNNPYIDGVLTYAKEEHMRSLSSARAFLSELRRGPPDLAIVLNTVSFSVTSAALAVLSGARFRMGSTSEPFGSDLSRRLYHAELPLPSPVDLETMHESEHNLFPLRPLGVTTTDLRSLLVPTSDETAWARALVGRHRERKPSIVIHPGAGKEENLWPAERFARAGLELKARLGARIFVVEGPRDGEVVAIVRKALGEDTTLVSRRTVGEIGALLEQTDLLLCNDTGIMHVAGAVGAKALALFGPTEPRRWKPLGDHVDYVRGVGGDLRSIDVETVVSKSLEILASRRVN